MANYKTTYLILIPTRPNFYRPPVHVHSSDPLPNIWKRATYSNLASVILMSKNYLPPPPNSLGKVDNNQVHVDYYDQIKAIPAVLTPTTEIKS